MRGFLALLFPLMGLTAALTIACGNAQANPDTDQKFLDTVRAAGYTGTDAAALRNGFIICAADTQDGVNDDLLGRAIDAAQRWLSQPDNPQLDAAFTTAAEQFLCPRGAAND